MKPYGSTSGAFVLVHHQRENFLCQMLHPRLLHDLPTHVLLKVSGQLGPIYFGHDLKGDRKALQGNKGTVLVVYRSSTSCERHFVRRVCLLCTLLQAPRMVPRRATFAEPEHVLVRRVLLRALRLVPITHRPRRLDYSQRSLQKDGCKTHTTNVDVSLRQSYSQYFSIQNKHGSIFGGKGVATFGKKVIMVLKPSTMS